MRQALILCGGRAERLRPYSYSLPKASLPFLNLPLLFLSWFYSEELKAEVFLLNSHLFPGKLEDTVDFLSQDKQKAHLFFEKEPLGSAGTLYQLRKELKKTEEFIYINGDSLFFPSQINSIFKFEEAFAVHPDLSALFFAAPYEPTGSKRALWCDRELNLKFVGAVEELAQSELEGLSPFSWSGMALFKSSLLDHLQKGCFDLFQDFINPLLKTHQIKVYADPLAVLLEAGDKYSYLSAVSFCLNCLFQSENLSLEQNNRSQNPNQIEAVKKILESCFDRFDPHDNRVGLKKGKIWSQKFNHPLLLPESVQGLDFLKLQGPAVIGRETCFFDQTLLDKSVLDSQIAFSGRLKQDILLKKSCV